MPESRRRALIDIARIHDVLIIESDAWGPLQPKRPPAFATLAPERVLYFTSLTKCLIPGLRVGYLVVPEALSASARNRHLVTNWMATSLMVEIASRWIEDGTALELLEWQKQAAARRNEIAASGLAGIPFFSQPTGLHVWLPLPGLDEAEFVAMARQLGVAVSPGASFSIGDGPTEAAVRICLGGMPEDRLSQGFEIIRRLIETGQEAPLRAM
jgi:DNA-binding transcriptional MocR family regulator